MVTYSQIEREFRLHCSKKEHEIGPLFEVNYYRIILDEGDTIRNFKGNSMYFITQWTGCRKLTRLQQPKLVLL